MQKRKESVQKKIKGGVIDNNHDRYRRALIDYWLEIGYLERIEHRGEDMTEHTFLLIEVSGDAYQMGYQHGAQATDLVQKYLLWIERLTGEDEHSDCRLHTNHYLTAPFANYETYSLPDSCPRLDRIRLLIRENWGEITVETLKRILADHHGDPGGICRHGEKNMHSISGYIAEPVKKVLHVRRGHGCLGTWQTYSV